MIKYYKRVIDFSNVLFVFYVLQVFNGPYIFLASWYETLFFAVFLCGNAYMCFVIVRVEKHTIKQVVQAFERGTSDDSDETGESKTQQREQIEWIENLLQRNLQWGDISELAFGRFFGRFLCEISLFIALFTTCTGQMFGLRLMTLEVSNNCSIAFTELCENFHYASWPIIVGIYLPLFSVAALLPDYRSAGIFSLIGFVIVCCQQVFVYIVVMSNICAFDNRRWKIVDDLDNYWFMSSVPQLSLIMLTVHGYFNEYRNDFKSGTITAFITGVITMVFSVYAIIKNLQHTGYEIHLVLHRVLFGKLSLRLSLIAPLVLLCILLNFPISNMLERKCCKPRLRHNENRLLIREGSNPNLQEFDIFDRFRKPSIFERLRYDPEARLTLDDIRVSKMESRVSFWKAFLIRFFLFAAEFGFCVLSVKYQKFNTFFSYLEATTAAFSGFILPYAIAVYLQWEDISILKKILPMALVLITIVLSYLGAADVIYASTPNGNNPNVSDDFCI